MLEELRSKLDSRCYDEEVLEYYDEVELELFRMLTLTLGIHEGIATDAMASYNYENSKLLLRFFKRYAPLMKLKREV